MGDSLLWVAHYDNATQSLSVYDPSETFSPEMVLPPGREPSDASKLGTLTNLTQGHIYFLSVSEAQIAVLGGAARTLSPGLNLIVW